MHKMLLCLLLVLGGCQTYLYAQETALIGPGDQVDIIVFDTPEMTQHPKVTDAGTIPLMFAGDVKVAGLTPGDAAHAIEGALIQRNFMLHPHVSVTVADSNLQVSVLGEVKSAGTYEMSAPVSVLSVLSMAGGLSSMADRHITIQRHGDANQRITYYLSNTSDKAFETSVLVNPGDTVLVPRVGLVYVLGDVGKPGGFAIESNDSEMTVLQALALAGTPNKTAMLSKAKLLRKSEAGIHEVPIQLGGMEKGKVPDLEMQPNDILYIPSSLIKNLVVNGSSIVASTASAAIYARP